MSSPSIRSCLLLQYWIKKSHICIVKKTIYRTKREGKSSKKNRITECPRYSHVWFASRQTCLDHVALPDIRFSSSNAKMLVWSSSCLGGLKPNNHVVLCAPTSIFEVVFFYALFNRKYECVQPNNRMT